MSNQEHRDPEVQKAIVRLDDALCVWERGTSVESVLIFREQCGLVHRSVSGKPGVPEFVTDDELITTVI